ncbi:MAG: hypothetical protein ACKO5R_07965 [Planctomycetaceae bacterium]
MALLAVHPDDTIAMNSRALETLGVPPGLVRLAKRLVAACRR